MTFIRAFSKRYFIDAMTGMAMGLFVTLIAGLIILQIGRWTHLLFLNDIGRIAILLMGAGIGAGIAQYLKAPPLVMLACMVAGLMGAHSDELTSNTFFIRGGVVAGAGNPISAYLAAVIAYRVGVLVSGKSSFDILLVPILVIAAAYAVCLWLCPAVVLAVNSIGNAVGAATALQPFLMGMVIAVSVGILLTLPTSSAAICIAIGLDGIAGGAAVVGCAAQMVGFAVASYRENGFGGLIAQGLGTSMIQIPNVFRKPIVMLPMIIASAIAGPIATVVLHLQSTAAGAGMGTAGLVGVFGVLDASNGQIPTLNMWIGIIGLMFILPAIICWLISEWMRKIGWLKAGDLALNMAQKA